MSGLPSPSPNSPGLGTSLGCWVVVRTIPDSRWLQTGTVRSVPEAFRNRQREECWAEREVKADQELPVPVIKDLLCLTAHRSQMLQKYRQKNVV